MSRFRRTLRQRYKDDGTLLTDADEAVDDALPSLVSESRDTDAFLGEEQARQALTGDGGLLMRSAGP